MKIVEVNPFFHPYDGGIERRIYDTSKLFAAKGHDVTVVTGRLSKDDPEEEVMDGFRVIRLKSRLIKIYNPPFISSRDVLGAVDSLNPDIVDYHYRWAPSYNADLADYDGPKVFTYHNMWGEGDGIVGAMSERNDSSFARKVLNTFDHVVTVSDYVKKDLLARGYSDKYVTSVPPGLDSRREAGSGSGDFMLSLGRLVRTKGLDYLIEAMKDVDHKLVICGKGPDAKRLQKAIRKAGLGDRVEMKGFVSDEERDRLMGECRFFVMPSLHESFGLAAVELMSRGRPLVCSDADGLPDTVGEAGYVVPKADSAALAEAMNRMFEDREMCETKASKAIEMSRAWDWDIQLPKLEEVYEKTVAGEYTEEDAFSE